VRGRRIEVEAEVGPRLRDRASPRAGALGERDRGRPSGLGRRSPAARAPAPVLAVAPCAAAVAAARS
jgi:hypothetical protein